MVIAIETTAGNVSDMNQLEIVLEKAGIAPKTEVYADKGYSSKNNRNYLKKRKLKSRIMHKKEKGVEMNPWMKKFNRMVSNIRYAIEQTFGSMVTELVEVDFFCLLKIFLIPQIPIPNLQFLLLSQD